MPFLLPLTMPLPLAFALRSRAASGEGSEYLIGADAAFVLGAELFACWVSSEPALNSVRQSYIDMQRTAHLSSHMLRQAPNACLSA